MKVLITSGRSPAGLELCRILSRSGHEVYAIESIPYNLCSWSNCIKKSFILPSPKQHLDNYKNQLIDIIKNKKIDIIIPCYEESFHIARIKSDLQKFCKIFVSDIDTLDTLHNKFLFIKKADSFDLNTLETTLLDTSNINYFKKEAKNYVFKPVYSRFGNHTLISPCIKSLKKINTNNEWIAQKRAYGEEFSYYAICEKGHILSWTIYKKEHTAFNVCVSFAHTTNSAIEQWSTRFIRQTSYTGQISFDFIIDKEGQANVLECNPRITSGIHNMKNFNMEKNKKTHYNKPSFIKLIALMQPSSRNLLNTKFWKDLLLSRDVILNKNDLAPLFGQIVFLIYLVFLAFKNNTTLSDITIADIKWDGEK